MARPCLHTLAQSSPSYNGLTATRAITALCQGAATQEHPPSTFRQARRHATSAPPRQQHRCHIPSLALELLKLLLSINSTLGSIITISSSSRPPCG